LIAPVTGLMASNPHIPIGMMATAVVAVFDFFTSTCQSKFD
jgi:hypothetical protein